MDLQAMGRAGLTGWRGGIAQKLAGPIARRTGLDRDQVLAIFGGVLLLLTIYHFWRGMARILRAGRGEPVPV